MQLQWKLGSIVNDQSCRLLYSINLPRSNTNIVLFLGKVKLSKSPINQAKLAKLMVNHNIVRLDITMHNSLRMAVI